jgi:peptidoglycan/LPS O-acetylase OafA/YrhL
VETARQPLSDRAQQASRNGAVDAIKGFAIVSVLLIHSLPRHVLADSYAVFHIWEAVPLLIMMMGYTGVLARVQPIRAYFRRRAVRLLIPWAVAWLAGVAFVALRGDLASVIRPDVLLGALPLKGASGNYFITIVAQFVLVLPLLRKLLDRGPWVFIGTCLALDLSFQLVAGHFGLSDYAFKACLLRYLFAVGLGMLIAKGRNPWVLAPFSIAFLFAWARGFRMPFIAQTWQAQSLFAAGYPAALVLLGLKLQYPSFLRTLGRMSWHIFLVQALWFGGVGSALLRHLPITLSTGPRVLLDVAACLVLGVLFALVEEWATGRCGRLWNARRPAPAQ